MESTVKLNKDKYRFFIFENENALKLLKVQEAEILEWRKLVETFLDKINTSKDAVDKKIDLLYQTSINKLKSDIQSIIDLMEIQLNRIENDLILEIENDHEAYMIQDILREKAKQLQNFYIDFKYKLMIHLSTYH